MYKYKTATKMQGGRGGGIQCICIWINMTRLSPKKSITKKTADNFSSHNVKESSGVGKIWLTEATVSTNTWQNMTKI